jgi:hypothetical protein
MLRDLEAAADGALASDEKVLELRAATRTLLERQFVHADTGPDRRVYDLVRSYRKYFTDYFDGAGYDLIVDEGEQLVGIIGQDGMRVRRMTLNQTMVMLALRIVFEEQTRLGTPLDRGRCEASLREIWELIEQRTGRPMPPPTRCREVLDVFQRSGVVRLYEVPDGTVMVEIRPVILRLLSGASLAGLERYTPSGREAAGEAPDQETEDEP